ncbi:MAG: hypothetical protein HOI23_09760 [Deltaproteobacteria bacterium]|jgi:beta-galactosidase|nr:hypothetical protein [Deltaproteobacteria bacterium]MBT6433965.1 hypothetical protein [Deltaproteobacteria bacterium]MBT6490657.1 hypothetical protein [Deltaproteobacteria bacterium]
MISTLALVVSLLAAPQPNVELVNEQGNRLLLVDGKPTLVKGMNWGWMPIGHNYSFSLWNQPEEVIIEALKRDMTLLKDMGINAIRQIDGIPPKWVEYIYDRWGIMSAVNNFLGRYGMLVEGRWENPTNYENPKTRQAIVEQVRAMAERYKDTRGILFFMLGNENNYGLHWSSYEIEALPKGKRDVARATHLYSLLGEAATVIKKITPDHLTVWANGDVQYIDLFDKLAKDVDIFGSNVYRGASARDLYEVVEKQSQRAIVYTEFGADAYNARLQREDGRSQAEYVYAQWCEIYQQSGGHGAGNAIGGFIFQWSDGWWKTKQDEDLEIHNNNATWPNGGYVEDFVEGQNNMNEEWFGIAAKGPTDVNELYEVYPRSTYYVMRDLFKLSPYELNDSQIKDIYNTVPAQKRTAYANQYETDRLEREGSSFYGLRLDHMRFRTEISVASRVDKPSAAGQVEDQEQVWLGLRYNPNDDLTAGVKLHALGNVLENPIDEIYYENRGTAYTVEDTTGEKVVIRDAERFALYQFDMTLKSKWLDVEAYYRSGHYHWGNEGDIYAFYPEANYQHSVDMYGSNAPFGAVLTGHQALEGLKIAAGPELHWGAPPALIGKYRRTFGGMTATVTHREEFKRPNDAADASGASSKFSGPSARKSSLVLEMKPFGWNLTISGLASSSNKVGQTYTLARDAGGEPSYLNSGWFILDDRITWFDTLGGDVSMNGHLGTVGVHVSGGYRGLVADAGYDPRLHLTGWSLKPAGTGNRYHAELGVLVPIGNFQIAPHILYQKPLEGPLPDIAAAYINDSGTYYTGIAPRSVLDSPFAVLDNREMLGVELLLVWDPTPGTWYWMWDNTMREDASFAASLDIIYRHYPTTRDSQIAFLESGIPFSQASSPPARDNLTIHTRMLIRPTKRWRILVTGSIAHDDPGIGGEKSSTHWPWRKSVFAQARYQGLLASMTAKFDDWGPYDYHRDFNLTYPVQLEGMLSWGPNRAKLYDQDTRIGVMGKYRTLDENSNRFVPDMGPGSLNEWEVRIFLEVVGNGI